MNDVRNMNEEEGEIQERDRIPAEVCLNGDPCCDFSDDARSNKTSDSDDGDNNDDNQSKQPHQRLPRSDTVSVSMDHDDEAKTGDPAQNVPENTQDVQVTCSTSKVLTDDAIKRISLVFQMERDVTIEILRPHSSDGCILHVKMTVENDDENVSNLANEFMNFCKENGIELNYLR